MSTAVERTDVIKRNYSDAQENEPFDLARAQTAADVTAIQANVLNARHLFYAAIAAQLTQDGPDVEAAFQSATQAQAAARQAREQSAQIAELVARLTSATTAARNLLEAAQKT